MALDETLTLENLAVAMHGEGGVHPARRRLLLEGYFALKREATVELLAACHGRAVRVEKYRENPATKIGWPQGLSCLVSQEWLLTKREAPDCQPFPTSPEVR